MSKPKPSKFNKKKKQTKSNKISKKKNVNKDKTQQTLKNKSEKQSPMFSVKEIREKYPILNDKELIKKIHAVTMTNNQKGRIRQLLRDNLIGTSEKLLPDVINCKIQGILRSSEDLTEAELRKIRILFNMLKTATDACIKKVIPDATIDTSDIKIENLENKQLVKIDKDETSLDDNEINDNKKLKEGKSHIKGSKEDNDVKKKGPKRYVVFVGNLSTDIDKEKLMNHFKDISTKIKDIRLPPRGDNNKSCIAYLELEDEPSYEMALSKHHSMLQNKRIKVLYSTQKNSKVSKEEAKSKSAKLVALQKTGKLIGSIPINRKRSFRRKKQKLYEAKEND